MDQTTQLAETFAERRKHERYSLKLRIHYSAQCTPEQQTLMTQTISRDLGLGGIALVVNEKLETGQTIRINIELPNLEDELNTDAETISAAVKNVVILSRVVWSRLIDDRRYIVGVQFLDLETEDARILKGFLEEYKLRDSNLNQDKIESNGE